MIKKYAILKKKAKIFDILWDRLMLGSEGERIKMFTFRLLPRGAILFVVDVMDQDSKRSYKSNLTTTDPRTLEDKLLDVLHQYEEDKIL